MAPPQDTSSDSSGPCGQNGRKRINLEMLRNDREKLGAEAIRIMRKKHQLQAENEKLEKLWEVLENVRDNMDHSDLCLTEATENLKREELLRGLSEEMTPKSFQGYCYSSSPESWEGLFNGRTDELSSPPGLFEDSPIDTPSPYQNRSVSGSSASPNSSFGEAENSPYSESGAYSPSSASGEYGSYKFDLLVLVPSVENGNQNHQGTTNPSYRKEQNSYDCTPPEKFLKLNDFDSEVFTPNEREESLKTPPPQSVPRRLRLGKRKFEFQSCKAKKSLSGSETLEENGDKVKGVDHVPKLAEAEKSHPGGAESSTTTQAGDSSLTELMKELHIENSQPNAEEKATNVSESIIQNVQHSNDTLELNKGSPDISVNDYAAKMSVHNPGSQVEKTEIADLTSSLQKVSIEGKQSRSNPENSSKKVQNDFSKKCDVPNGSVFINEVLNCDFDKQETVEETEKSEIASKDSEISSKDSDIAAKDSDIAAMDSEMLANESVIAVKDSETVSKVSEMASKGTEIASKDSEIASKDSGIASRDSEIASKDSEIATIISEMATIAVKNSEIVSKVSEIAYKDSDIVSKDSDIAAKDSEMAAKGSAIVAKESTIFAQESEIAGPTDKDSDHSDTMAKTATRDNKQAKDVGNSRGTTCAANETMQKLETPREETNSQTLTRESEAVRESDGKKMLKNGLSPDMVLTDTSDLSQKVVEQQGHEMAAAAADMNLTSSDFLGF